MGTQAPGRGPTGHTMRSALGRAMARDVHRGVDVELGDQRVLCDADEPRLVECYIFLQCVRVRPSIRPCNDANQTIAIAFDFTVLIFTTVALTYKHSARTDLWKLLFQDGLVYFVRLSLRWLS